MQASGQLFNGTGQMRCAAYKLAREDGSTALVQVACDEQGPCQEHSQMLRLTMDMRANNAVRNATVREDFKKGLDEPPPAGPLPPAL